MKTFTKLFSAAGVLLAAILIMPVTASAKNMYLTHGNDYEYTIDGDSFFPVVWDIRSAWMNYRSYARYYIGYEDPQAFAYADRELSGILLQAKNAGVNSVIIRESLRLFLSVMLLWSGYTASMSLTGFMMLRIRLIRGILRILFQIITPGATILGFP